MHSILFIVQVWILWQSFYIPYFNPRADIPTEQSGEKRSGMSRLNNELKWCVLVCVCVRDKQRGKDREEWKNEIDNAAKLIANRFKCRSVLQP